MIGGVVNNTCYSSRCAPIPASDLSLDFWSVYLMEFSDYRLLPELSGLQL